MEQIPVIGSRVESTNPSFCVGKKGVVTAIYRTDDPFITHVAVEWDNVPSDWPYGDTMTSAPSINDLKYENSIRT